MTEIVKSPCISVCALDPDDICTGCFRSLREIGDWSSYSNDEKREVVTEARQRMRDYFHLSTTN
ncbi:MAG TPA: DUF1289 domain-containing protein [Spongiibacteraceae bacterium]|nr:DUF1289 domain-containing protein [Spongiibacteraceae bacterium]HCS29117.1 DUF1289 domain-containing protein [Spongiibacteraceae bacterium]|tara:strand:- start:481 stop:672 length:192 start_codon:yes stop_codon:yes gene_type:complete